MPIFVAEIDIARGVEQIALDPRYDTLWLLVRHGRRIMGWLRLQRPPYGFVYGADELRSAIQREFGWATLVAVTVELTPPPAPPISVIVCTRDRPEPLRRCLAALARLDYPAFEVIVVDNASQTPATCEVVAAPPFRYVREDRPGLDWARNRGAAEARHALIAYTDDDVRVDRDWLWGVAAAFADPQVAAMTGLVLPAELETQAQIIFERYGGMSKGFAPRLFQRDRMDNAGLIGAHQCGVGANMAFRRETLAQVGGFDTALDVGTPSFGGGDIDMFHRVLAAGLDLQYEPTALVWHQHRRDRPGLYRQIYSNGRAFGVYLGKIWRDQTAPRRATLRYGVGWAGGWVLKRLIDRLRGRLDLPLELVWSEVWGMLHAPAAFRATYAHDRRMRERNVSSVEGRSVGIADFGPTETYEK